MLLFGFFMQSLSASVDLHKRDSVTKDPSFVIALCVTVLVLFAITAPILAIIIFTLRHKRRQAQQFEDDLHPNASSPSMYQMKKSEEVYRPNSIAESDHGASTSSKEEDDQPIGQRLSSSGAMDKTILEISPSQGTIVAPFDRIIVGGIYIINKEYTAREFDEMTVNIGNAIQIVKVYDDGWCLCRNQETGNKGVVPSDCFAF